MDVLSETLGAMKITGNVLLNEAYSAPWAVSIPNKAALSQSLNANKNTHIAAFHFVQRGYIEIELEKGNKETVLAGELAICFSGIAHTLYQGTSKSALPFKEIMEGNNPFKPTSENDAQSTSLICGIFMLHNTYLNPLYEALPPLLKISIAPGKDYSFSSTASILNLLLNEISQQSLAYDYMIERYLELLCAKAIRLHIESTSTNEINWLHALKDSTIARAVTSIHSQPEYDWSVKKIAQGVSLSPSRF
ncbi:MAG: cupin domain-containing protein, partial [Woeseiaceae bacterium]